jgi:hypothetical protein
MVEVNEANAREAGAAADRLIRDVFLQEALDEMIGMATEKAITGADRRVRREARHDCLAIMRLRDNLRAVFENWQAAADLHKRERAHE